MSRVRSRRKRAAVAALVLVPPVAAGGCANITQDIQALGAALTPVTPSDAARMMMDPHDPDNRRRGTVLISNSPFGGHDPYVAAYRDRVRNERDPLVKAASLTALGRYGRPEDAPLIARALDDERFQVRWEAAKALQRIHNPAVIGDLLGTLRDSEEHADIRVAAATALGQYPQDNVFQGLVEALDAPQLAVNDAARGSLLTITGQDHGLAPAPWLRWYAGAEAPFSGRREYVYPTYQREETWLEKLAFWSSPTYEQPGPPAGLEPPPRRTYADSEDESAADEAGR